MGKPTDFVFWAPLDHIIELHCRFIAHSAKYVGRHAFHGRISHPPAELEHQRRDGLLLLLPTTLSRRSFGARSLRSVADPSAACQAPRGELVATLASCSGVRLTTRRSAISKRDLRSEGFGRSGHYGSSGRLAATPRISPPPLLH